MVEGGGWKLLRHESAEGQGVKADGGAIFVVDNLLFQALLVRSYRELSGVIGSYQELSGVIRSYRELSGEVMSIRSTFGRLHGKNSTSRRLVNSREQSSLTPR